MSTNVERKGKEKPKKKGRRKGNQPTVPSLGRELKDRQELKTLSSVPLQMQGMGGMDNSETCWCRWRGWNCVGERFARFRVSLSGTHGRETCSPSLHLLLFIWVFHFFFFFWRNCSFPSWPFCSKTKKVAGLCSRRQEVGLWGLCLLIFCPKAMEGIFSLIFSDWELVRPGQRPLFGCFIPDEGWDSFMS